MVPLPEVIASNGRIAKTFPQGLVAVFVGGTSGVGEYTVKKLAKYAAKPRVYLVGRSQSAADRIIQECMEINPGAEFNFIQSDISLLKNVDDVCREIKKKESSINILIETQGTMGFQKSMYCPAAQSILATNNNRNPIATNEGLPLATALTVHSRIRFILNLLPLLQKAEQLRRVVSVGAATCEGAIDLNNISGQGLPLMKWRDQSASVQSLLLEKVARQAPDVSFVHTVPGVVKSGISRDAKGAGLSLMILISRLLEPLIAVPPDECGERHLFLCTSSMYPPSQHKASVGGVDMDETMKLARAHDGKPGTGMYSVDNKGESASPRVEQLLATFKSDGTSQRVWDYVMDGFREICGTEVAV